MLNIHLSDILFSIYVVGNLFDTLASNIRL